MLYIINSEGWFDGPVQKQRKGALYDTEDQLPMPAIGPDHSHEMRCIAHESPVRQQTVNPEVFVAEKAFDSHAASNISHATKTGQQQLSTVFSNTRLTRCCRALVAARLKTLMPGPSFDHRQSIVLPLCFATAPALSARFRKARWKISLQKSTYYRPKPSRSVVHNLLVEGPVGNAPEFAPVLILPGLGNSTADYASLASNLVARGHAAVSIAPVARWKWSLNARGFFTSDYWKGTLRPEQVLKWYFGCVDLGLKELFEAGVDREGISVIGHSAGGWLGRAYLAECAPAELRVSTLVTLGTPHKAPPEGQIDQTRGLLNYIDSHCEVSDLVDDFVCVAGSGTVGKQFGKGSVGEYVAYLSYAAVSGEGNVDGDGVTPVNAACATSGKLVVCEDCDHSMLTSEKWYGNGAAYQKWVNLLP